MSRHCFDLVQQQQQHCYSFLPLLLQPHRFGCGLMSRVTLHTSQTHCHRSQVTGQVTRHSQTSKNTRQNVTNHASHVARHTSHVTRHTSHVTRHKSHVTRHLSEQPSTAHGLEQVPARVAKGHMSQHNTSNIKHVARHTSHVTRRTSHVTRHTSHVTCAAATMECRQNLKGGRGGTQECRTRAEGMCDV